MISSPIPVDPGYHGKGDQGSGMLDTRPVPRVRPEAEEIATRAQGSVGLLLQLQGQPVYRAPIVRKPEPKNFSQENVRRMRKIQAMSRKKKAEETIIKHQPVKVLPQSEKYKDVPSKVAAHIQQEPLAPRPASASYLKSYSRPGSAPPKLRCPTPEPKQNYHNQIVKGKSVSLEVQGQNPASRSRHAQHNSLSTNTRNCSSSQEPQRRRPDSARVRGRSSSQDPQQRRPQTADARGRSYSKDQQQRLEATRHRGRSPSPGPRPRTSSSSSDIDFIAHNARLARKHKPHRPPSVMAKTALDDKRKSDMHNYSKGEVPKYLRNRQNQWQEEEAERLRSIPDPEMPPGHKMMPKEERLETLNILKQKQKELHLQLHKIPLNAETLRARTLKTDIETKLAEVDEAIKIFSRNKVFIKIDC